MKRKKAAKKPVKKAKRSKPKAKKIVRKIAVKAAAKKSVVKVEKPIGSVRHYFSNIKVAIVKFKKDVKVGAQLRFKGATTDFKGTIGSMQFNHAPIKIAKKGKEVGLKVARKVRVGDSVYGA